MGVSLFLFTVKAKKQKIIVIVNIQICLKKKTIFLFRRSRFYYTKYIYREQYVFDRLDLISQSLVVDYRTKNISK